MRYIAFLRAINVGKHNRIRMEALRGLCVDVGLENVSTYLQTGNVIFESTRPEAELADLIEEMATANGLRNVSAAIRTHHELKAFLATAAFARHPMPAFGQLVTLYRDPLPEEARAFAQQDPGVVAVTARELCVAIDRSLPVPRRDISSTLEKRFDVRGTTRYWHVVEASAALLAPPSS